MNRSDKVIGGRIIISANSDLAKQGFYLQRARPWYAFRIGTSLCALNDDLAVKFVRKIKSNLLQNGIVLDEDPLFFLTKVSGMHELEAQIKNAHDTIVMEYEVGPLSTPIVIAIEDFDTEGDILNFEHFCETFSESATFFKVKGNEVIEEIYSGNYMDNACKQFAANLSYFEGLEESIAVKDRNKKEKEPEFGAGPVITPFHERDELEEREQREKNRSRRMRGYNMNRRPYVQNISPPPGLSYQRPSSSQRVLNEKVVINPPPGLNLPPKLDQPPGLQLKHPPGLENITVRHDNQMLDFSSSEDEEELDAESATSSCLRGSSPRMVSHDDVVAALNRDRNVRWRRGELISSQNDAASLIAGPFLFNRFDEPFPEITENLDLLYLVNFSISSDSNEMRPHIQNILTHVFRNRFTMKLIERFVEPYANPTRWNICTADIIFEIGHFFGYVCIQKPVINKQMDDSWRRYLDSFFNIDCDEFIALRISQDEYSALESLCYSINKYWNSHTEVEEVRDYDEVDNGKISMNCSHREENGYQQNQPSRVEDFNRNGYQQIEPSRVEDFNGNGYHQKEPYHRVDELTKISERSEEEQAEIIEEVLEENDDEKVEHYVEVYKRSEMNEPPNDFRDCSSIPTLSDYCNPDGSYLRRIQENGVYKSADHFLDIQFRLLREDLVSPLRDGVFLYRMNGTWRNNMRADVQCSSITLYNISKIEGKQVSSRTGEEMRIAHLTPDYMNLPIGKEAKGGGIVLLSSDGFKDDFHVAIIQDFYMERNCISLIVVDESKTTPLKTDRSYQMAEGQGYLPAYRYVLDNLKKFNRFSPIPFERYLVNGKKNVHRPAYHRQMKSETQIIEEQRVTAHYNEIRSLAVAKRIEKGKSSQVSKSRKKAKKSKKPKNANFDDSFSDDDFKDYSESSEEDEYEEEELRQLKQPIFKTPIGYLSPEDGDKIRIDDQWYNISKLIETYHPTYMDESQRIAFCSTFNREFSIIQGPPGTGKTHIGVHIVKTMLLNRSHFRMNGPILVVCYTNAALDQFLEKIWQMTADCFELSRDDRTPRMIRFGAGANSELLEREKVLREHVMRDYKNIPTIDVSNRRSAAMGDKMRMQNELAVSSCGLYASRNDLVCYDIISRVMHPSFQAEMHNWACTHTDSREIRLSLDEAFACWLLDRQYGGTTNASIPKSSKFAPCDSDDEVYEHTENGYEESENGLDDETLLDRVFEKMNIDCKGADILQELTGERNEEYNSRTLWELVENQAAKVILLSSGEKEVGNRKFVPLDKEIVDSINEEKRAILNTVPLKKEETDDIKYIFSLARPKRWALYQYWCTLLRALICENLPICIRNYRTACEVAQKRQIDFDAAIAKRAMVVGATTSGCSRIRPLLDKVKPRILIVEEAAEVFESHILSAMVSSVEHVVMIGDHQQLRPKPAVHELGMYGLDISMFERLVERDFPYSQLKEQHRMNCDIADVIVRPSFYSHVYDADNVKEYPEVSGMATRLFFWSHTNREQSHDGMSYYNLLEIEMTAGLIAHLFRQGYTKNDITVITTYSAQKAEMTLQLLAVFGGSMDDPVVPVETVDSYQGKENKIVIVSLVRSHKGKQENTGIGFLGVKNRICVALTRAKHGMYVIGNGHYLRNNSRLWQDIVANLDNKNFISYELPLKCRAHGNIMIVKNPVDFEKESPEGGCKNVCGLAKPCGHECQRKCHPMWEDEHLQPCTYPCMQTCNNPVYQHACTKRCYEVCGECVKFVQLDLECGHTISTPCYKISSAKCDQRCSNILSCGHYCASRCGDECISSEECKEVVEMKLECGHTRIIGCFASKASEVIECIEKCSKPMLGCEHECQERCGLTCTIECQEQVNVKLPCSHSVAVKCCDFDGDEDDINALECKTYIQKKLEPCEHNQMILCGQEASTKYCDNMCREFLAQCSHQCGNTCGVCFETKRHSCQQKCEKFLNCGHRCISKCGTECPPCASFCSTTCSHMKCGVGENDGYGRTCDQMCVLCTNKCRNRCKHRSCSKLCFEECDVKVCSEKCTESLPKCGHACLGICGEKCPKICGTCHRDTYNSTISVMNNIEKKLYRLIEIPGCGHVFPVDFLDAYVTGLKGEGKPLVCPNDKCRKHIYDVWRYAKYVKRQTILKNETKCIAPVIDGKKITFGTALSKTQGFIFLIRQVLKNIPSGFKQGLNICRQMESIAVEMNSNISANLKKPEKEHLIVYYCQLADALTTIARVLNASEPLRTQLRRREGNPPRMEMLLMQMTSALNLFDKQMTILSEGVSQLSSIWKCEKAGAVIPKLKHTLVHSIANLYLMNLVKLLVMMKDDVPENIAKSLRNVCIDFFGQSDKKDFMSPMKNLEQIIFTNYPLIKSLDTFLQLSEFSIPTF